MQPTDELRRELKRLVRQRDRTRQRAEQIDSAIAATITAMREQRVTWDEIGTTLGMTKQAAYEHYGRAAKRANTPRK